MTINEVTFGDGIQAGILKPDGRKFKRYIFVRLNPKANSGKLKNLIGRISTEFITSHLDQEQDTVKFKDAIKKNNPYKNIAIVNLGLSVWGYEKINLEYFRQAMPGDRAFRNGMRASATRLHDYNSWEGGDKSLLVDSDFFYQKDGQSPIDFFISIGHAKKRKCRKLTQKIYKVLEAEKPGLVSHLFVEKGFVRKDKKTGAFISPLGFQEGFSNKVGADHILDRVLVEEDWIDFERNTYGTYIAIRKTEVREHVFEVLVDRLVERLRANGDTREEVKVRAYAKALYMGRFQNGTPLVLSDEALNREYWSVSGRDIPFDYSDDLGGLKCPFGAHIRRMNPNGSREKEVVVLRRSVLYKDKKKERSGMFFISLQGSIDRQLEPLFDRMEVPRHPDAIAYRPRVAKRTAFSEFEVPERYLSRDMMSDIEAGGNNLTVFRGGEYFFMPSLLYLKSLSE